jgi:hypothetical protein
MMIVYAVLPVARKLHWFWSMSRKQGADMSDENNRVENAKVNEQEKGQRQWSKLAERACKDAELKQRLLNDPAPLLREIGIEVPTGTEVRVTEEHGSLNCVIESGKAARAAAAGELAEADLANVAGGGRKAGGSNLVYLQYTFSTVFVT